MPEKKIVCYHRVSTSRQGQSGLGLEAQKEAITRYLNGRDWEIIEEFVEIESGKRNDRPQLQAALSACKKQNATLVIAKLDRLARNVHFISGLMEAGVEFVAVDNPNANKLMLHLLAAFAEHEREQISSRTKDALAAAKKRGVVLGSHGRDVLSRENHQAALDFARKMAGTVHQLREQGITTIRAIAAELNRLNIHTHTGTGSWYPAQVCKLLKRLRGLQGA